MSKYMSNEKGMKIDEQKNIGENPRRYGFYPPRKSISNMTRQNG